MDDQDFTDEELYTIARHAVMRGRHPDEVFNHSELIRLRSYALRREQERGEEVFN